MTAGTAGSPATARAAAWLQAGRGGMFLLALGVGAGLGAVAFVYLIYLFTWLASGHSEFGQAGHVGSAHLPWLGRGFFVVIPAIAGLLYRPLVYHWAREARGHGVPEVMIAVAGVGSKPVMRGDSRQSSRRRVIRIRLGEVAPANTRLLGDVLVHEISRGPGASWRELRQSSPCWDLLDTLEGTPGSTLLLRPGRSVRAGASRRGSRRGGGDGDWL